MAKRAAANPALWLPVDFSWNIPRLAFSPRATRLAAGDRQTDHVLVFDAHSGAVVANLKGLHDVDWLGFLSERLLLIIHAGRCTHCDLHRGTQSLFWADAMQLETAAIAPGGKLVAFGIGERYAGAGIALYGVRQRRVLRRMEIDLAIGFPPDRIVFGALGRYVAAVMPVVEGGSQRIIPVWNALLGRRYRTYLAPCTALAFREDTLDMALGIGDEVALFDDVRGEDPIATFAAGGYVNALRFVGHGRIAILTYGGTVSLHRLGYDRVRRWLPPPGRKVETVVASADWSLFAGVSEGGVVVWSGAELLS